MREIKFKAKRVDGKGWVFGSFVLDSDNNPRITTIDKSGEGLVFHKVIPETVCQFTGLKDKNGVDIYEGDKVKILGGEEHHGYRELSELCEVKFSQGSFCAVDKDNIYYDLGIIDEIEVTGNIHD